MGELAPTPATFPASCTLASGGTPSGEESSPCEADGDAALRASLQEPLSLARVTQPAEAPPEQACRKRAYNSPFNIVLRANRPRCSLLLRSPSDTAEEPVPRAVKRKVSRNKRTRPAASRGVPRVRSEDASAELGSLDEQAVWSQTQRQNSEECRTTPEGPASSQCPTPPVEIAAFAKGLRWHQSSRRAASLLTKTECAPLPVCESSSFLPFEGCAEGLSSGGPPSVRETVSPAPNEKSLAAADAQPAERSTCASFVEPLRAPTLAELIDFVSFRADKGTAAPSRPDGDLPIVKRRERGGTFFFLKPKPDASLCAARLLATALLTHPGGLFDIFADVEDKIPSAFSECREARASEDSAHGAEEEGASVFACGRLSSSDQEGDEELFVREVHLLRGGLGKAVRLRLERGLALLLAQTPSLLRFLGEVCAFCKAKTNAKEEAFPAALGRSISLLGSETSLSRSADALWLLHSLLHHAKGEKNPSQQETLAQQGCRLLDAAFSERERGFAALALGLCGSRWKRQLRDRLSSDAPLTADKQTETQNLDCEDAPQRLALERLLRLPDGKDSIPDLASASEKQKVALAVAAAAAAGQRVISVQRVGRAVAFKRFSPPLFSFCNASEPPPAEQQQVARGEETSASLNSESFSEEAAVDKKPPTSQPSQQALENSFAQTLFPGLLIRTDGRLPLPLDSQIAREEQYATAIRKKRFEVERTFRESWRGEEDRKWVALPVEALVLQRSSVHGFGVFATEFIPGGTALLEYTGEVYVHAKNLRPEPPRLVEVRESRYDWQHGNCYCFSVDAPLHTKFVDATDAGNIARYINHSCEPNCESRIVDGGRVAIVALRDIVAGEELFYDYQ